MDAVSIIEGDRAARLVMTDTGWAVEFTGFKNRNWDGNAVLTRTEAASAVRLLTYALERLPNNGG